MRGKELANPAVGHVFFSSPPSEFYPTRRIGESDTDALARNRSTRTKYIPEGSFSPRSQRASVPGSTPMRFAASDCDSPIDVRCLTSRPSKVVAAGRGL